MTTMRVTLRLPDRTDPAPPCGPLGAAGFVSRRNHFRSPVPVPKATQGRALPIGHRPPAESERSASNARPQRL